VKDEPKREVASQDGEEGNEDQFVEGLEGTGRKI